ncbi:MAG: DNA-binding response regulator [Bdellovibrionaceae bacterium]|nr:DNA-binding response regulator [Pseudobdellovibrionaceae bacterium]
MSVGRVLIVDDDSDVRDYLVGALSQQGFDAVSIDSGNNIVPVTRQLKPDLILLDHRMPGVTGSDVIRNVKSDPELYRIPIIMVTGVDTEEQKVEALELGADDYIVKPFLPRELSARIKAVLRRTMTQPQVVQEFNTLESGELAVDLRSHKVTRSGEEVYLTLTEFRILSELLKRKGQVLSRDRLRETALGNLNVTDRTIDVHMASLRKKLDDEARHIQTVRGVGYRFS